MMYVVSTDYEIFAFETREELNDFLATATLPEYEVKEVEPSSTYAWLVLDTRWRMM